MQAKILINIKQLLQVEAIAKTKVSGAAMKTLPKIDNAFLIIKNEAIFDFGKMEDAPVTGDDDDDEDDDG